MTGTGNVNFSSRGSNYTATASDIFMDNGANIVFIRNGKYASPAAPRVPVTPNEWSRIKSRLTEIGYEEYFGRKPAIGGVTIYKVKQ